MKNRNSKIKSFNELLGLGLIDVWREINKDKQDYTFQRISKNKEKKSRIDLTLVHNEAIVDNPNPNSSLKDLIFEFLFFIFLFKLSILSFG